MDMVSQTDTSDQRPEPLMTVPEVARCLRISRSLVYQLVESGKLAVYRVGNGRGAIRFRPEDIESYLESCRSETVSPTQLRPPRPRLKHIRVR